MSFGTTPRQMYQVDLSCAKCNKHISELPFLPQEGRDVYCRDCNAQMRGDRGMRGGDRGARGARPPRQMFSGNWTCSSCGATILELPFNPRSTENLLCTTCLRAKNQAAA